MRRNKQKPTFDEEALTESYNRQYSLMESAEFELRKILERVVSQIQDKDLVRARIVDGRIKSLESVLIKLKRKSKAKPSPFFFEALTIFDINDLIGFRVVCNNLIDVHRFFELLRENLPSNAYVTIENYIEKPKQSGYRALHVNIRMNIEQRARLKSTVRVPFEVQIRTLMQDSFARLSHRDVYKRATPLPNDLQKSTIDLASLLSQADIIANTIRSQISKERVPPRKRPQLYKATKNGLTYIFSNKFGRNPSEYSIQEAINECKRLNVSTLRGLRKLLDDNAFREAISDIYSEESGHQVNHEEFFLASINGLAGGKEKGIEYAKADAKQKGIEIRNIWKDLILAEMPNNYRDFKSKLENSNLNIEEIADALDSITYCSACGIKLINSEALEESVATFYEVDIPFGELDSILYNLGLEMPDHDFPDMCNYHAEQLSKD